MQVTRFSKMSIEDINLSGMFNVLQIDGDKAQKPADTSKEASTTLTRKAIPAVFLPTKTKPAWAKLVEEIEAKTRANPKYRPQIVKRTTREPVFVIDKKGTPKGSARRPMKSGEDMDVLASMMRSHDINASEHSAPVTLPSNIKLHVNVEFRVAGWPIPVCTNYRTEILPTENPSRIWERIRIEHCVHLCYVNKNELSPNKWVFEIDGARGTGDGGFAAWYATATVWDGNVDETFNRYLKECRALGKDLEILADIKKTLEPETDIDSEQPSNVIVAGTVTVFFDVPATT
jgi:hypothetical protein